MSGVTALPEWLRELGRQSYERGYDLAAIQRQTAAIAASAAQWIDTQP